MAGSTVGSNVSVVLNQQVVSFGNCFSQTTLPVTSLTFSITAQDVNGDGKPDLIIANYNSNSVSVRLGDGRGSFGTAIDYAVETSPGSVAVADVNSDGQPDLLVTNVASNNVSVLLGTGSGSFAAPTNFAVGSNPFSVAVGDVNGDGQSDIITANYFGRNVSVLLGTGTGSFSAAANYAVGGITQYVTVGDVNGDGKLDIVAGNFDKSTVSVLLGAGTGSFSAAVNYAVGNNPTWVALGDVNRDGLVDMVTANLGNNYVSLLVGTGAGSFASATNIPIGGTAYSVALDDMNGDGQLDIITANSNTDNASVVLGDGAGNFGMATNFSVGAVPNSMVVRDVDSDGQPDILTANQASSTVSILLQKQAIGFISQPVATTSVAVGATVTASVSVSGTAPFSYQWFKNSLASPVAGQTSATLTLTSVNLADAGSYSVVVTGGCGPVTSMAFNLVITQPIRYVKAGSSGDGSSWATASGDLQAMINAEGVQQVWVAAGTYKPTSTVDRSISFVMVNNVQVLGGFPASGNPDLTQRSPESFTTILSGDIGTEGDMGDNAFHVVQFKNASSQTRLDGLVITGGNASGFTSPTGYGGAIYNDGSEGGNSSPTLTNLSLIANVANLGGGGLYTNGLGGNSSPVLTNVSFIGNSTPYEGGAMHTVGSCSPVLTNVQFIANSAESGGAMFNKAYLTSSRFVLTNVSFLNNFAYVQGGAMYNTANQADCQFQLTNVSLLGNSAPYDGGSIVSIDVSLTLTNAVIFGNQGSATLVNYNSPVTAYSSLFDVGVTDYIDGGNNQTTTILPFVSATDLRLAPGSPAFNAGDNAAYTTADGPATDLAGNVRIQNGTIDMGAYELGLPTDLTPVVYARTLQVDRTTTLSLVVDVFEINIAPTTAPLTVRITKDAKVTLTFDNSLSSVGGRSVQNSAWSFDATQPGYYQLSTTAPLVAGAIRSLGLTGVLTPTGTAGMISLSATVAGGGEDNLANNTDADKIEYFQQ
ncbi:hypothetical protein GCM10028773_12050 [Spirosoma koreense]